ncbi:MAG: DMT family transporter [Woeseiaceae bacterium]|nr:DMT family transporter [Woeseiaceae bacterium]
MDSTVFILVLLAALTHAAWNAWLKNTSPDFIGLAALATGWLTTACIALPFVGPPEPVHWKYLLTTTIVHTIYAALLVSAYRHGELSLVFPIARGSAPLIVALVSPWVLMERLAGFDLLAVVLIASGILIIGLAGAGSNVRDRHAVLLSLATGATIASYTIIDASGARAGTSPHVYSVWLFVLASIAQIAVSTLVHRSATLALLKPHLVRGITVGILSAVAYGAVLWAMSVAPAALVAAVRETSILFAALIGWLLLGEKVGRFRWIGVVITVAGLIAGRL